MTAKTILALCASALFVQTISAACIGAPAAAVVSAPAAVLPAPCAALPSLSNIAVSNSGGPFVVTSASPIAPSGISVLSENVIDGALAVDGEVPFLSAVALEGQVPSAGSSAVSYSCGNGNVGIVSETLPSASYAAAPLAAAGYGSLGLAPAAAYAVAPLAAAGYGSLGLAPAAAYAAPARIGAGYATAPLAYAAPSCI